MMMTMRKDETKAEARARRDDLYRRELGPREVDRLNATHAFASERYVHYRRKGHSAATALNFARAWARNMREQEERRRSHETGYEPDRGPWERS